MVPKTSQKANSFKHKQKVAAPLGNAKSTVIPGWAIAVVLGFTVLIWSRALFNNFVYLDDDQYILTNPFIRDFSFNGIKALEINSRTKTSRSV